MQEEKDLRNENEDEEEQDNNIYLEQIKKLKENSVSKDDYEKLEKERNELVKAFVEGKDIDIPGTSKEEEETDTEINNLRESLLKEDSELSNLEFWENSLKLRKAIIERDGEEADPFLPHSSQFAPSEDDRASVDRVVSVVEECIEKAEGNAETFRALLNAKILDDKMPTKRK